MTILENFPNFRPIKKIFYYKFVQAGSIIKRKKKEKKKKEKKKKGIQN